MQPRETEIESAIGFATTTRLVANFLAIASGVGLLSLAYDSWWSGWVNIFSQLIGPFAVIVGVGLAVVCFLKRRRLEAVYCFGSSVIFAAVIFFLARAAHSELFGG